MLSTGTRGQSSTELPSAPAGRAGCGMGGPASTAVQGPGAGASACGFSEVLARYLQRLEHLRRRGASEASICDAFLGFLRDAFPRLEAAEPILLKKKHIPGLKVRGGYADALYSDLILECKKRLDDRARAQGLEELKRYLRNQQHPQPFFGILTDGQRLEVFALRENGLAPVDRLGWAAQGEEEARHWLDSYLFHERNVRPTALDVALRFGERNAVFFQSSQALEGLWREVAHLASAQTKFVQWQSLLALVYGWQVNDAARLGRILYARLARGTDLAPSGVFGPAEGGGGAIASGPFVCIGHVSFPRRRAAAGSGLAGRPVDRLVCRASGGPGRASAGSYDCQDEPPAGPRCGPERLCQAVYASHLALSDQRAFRCSQRSGPAGHPPPALWDSGPWQRSALVAAAKSVTRGHLSGDTRFSLPPRAEKWLVLRRVQSSPSVGVELCHESRTLRADCGAAGHAGRCQGRDDAVPHRRGGPCPEFHHAAVRDRSGRVDAPACPRL